MGLWHFQEGTGATISDSSGRSHNGSFSNPGWADGVLGWAGVFNGSNSTVALGEHADFNNLGAMTLEGWIYLSRSGWGMPLIKGVDGAGQYSIRVNGDNNLEFTTASNGGDQTVVGGTKLPVGQWVHFAAVHNGGSQQWLYINGVLAGYKSNSQAPLQRTYALYIGNAPWWSGMAFAGMVQHVRISNIARSDFQYAKIDTQPSVTAGIQQTPPVSIAADLFVQSIHVYPQTNGASLVEVVVKNQGSTTTGNSFATDLYINHQPGGVGDYSSMQFWVNEPIAPGASVTLTATLFEFTLPPLLAAGQTTAEDTWRTYYVQTDSSGAIQETNNTNNIYPTAIDACSAYADAYENNNTAAEAQTLTTPQTHNFDRANDKDWLKFSALQDQTYRIKTTDLGAAADTNLTLFDQDAQTILATNDDITGSQASQITWTAPANGSYYILVEQWNPLIFGCQTGYTIKLTGANDVYLPMLAR
jgi:hypothetical protein